MFLVNPPFLLVIVAHPYAADSIAVRPKGSSHLEGTTEIEDLLYKDKISLCFFHPKSLSLL